MPRAGGARGRAGRLALKRGSERRGAYLCDLGRRRVVAIERRRDGLAVVDAASRGTQRRVVIEARLEPREAAGLAAVYLEDQRSSPTWLRSRRRLRRRGG